MRRYEARRYGHTWFIYDTLADIYDAPEKAVELDFDSYDLVLLVCNAMNEQWERWEPQTLELTGLAHFITSN